MLFLQDHYQCHNINLVTPTHFVPNILDAIYIAARNGLKIPIVYNCAAYESVETLKILDGIIDIYMPDFKYNSPERAKLALKEMDLQVVGIKLDERGIAYRRLLIRHLVLPGGLEDTKKVLDFIKEELSPDCLLNLMDQYYPAHKAHEYEEISRRLDYKEYQEAYNYAKKMGLRLV